MNFTLISPIHPNYHVYRKICYVNQWFGENRVDFYQKLNLLGHNGIDLRTSHPFQYFYHNVLRFRREPVFSPRGVIPIVAAHDGYLTAGKNNDRTRGIYMTIEKETQIYGRPCRVKTVYFHLDRVRRWRGDGIDPDDYVKEGTIIGYSDNTGEYTTGAHLHFGMKVYWRQPTGDYIAHEWNGYDGYIDPLPYLQDGVIYQQGTFRRTFIYNGRVITLAEVKKLLAYAK